MRLELQKGEDEVRRGTRYAGEEEEGTKRRTRGKEREWVCDRVEGREGKRAERGQLCEIELRTTGRTSCCLLPPRSSRHGDQASAQASSRVVCAVGPLVPLREQGARSIGAACSGTSSVGSNGLTLTSRSRLRDSSSEGGWGSGHTDSDDSNAFGNATATTAHCSPFSCSI